MRFNQKYISIILFLLCFICAYAQLDKNKPQIGYVYPAGARQGKTVQIMAGGQFLRGASDVYISGEGVSAKVIRHTRMINNLNGDQRKELQRQLKYTKDLEHGVVDKKSQSSPKAKKSKNKMSNDELHKAVMSNSLDSSQTEQ